MRTLGAWVGACVALALGVAVGRAGLEPCTAATLVIVALALAVAAWCFALFGASRAATGWLVGALWLGLFARGLDHGAMPAPVLREGDRGGTGGLRDLDVVGASTPGARCRAIVRMRGSEVSWSVSLPPERCPLASGDRLRARDPVAALGPSRPGSPDPGPIARASGADRSADLREVWRSLEGDAAEGSVLDRASAFVAQERQRAWVHGHGDDGRALVVATALGQRAALAPARRRELRAAGLGHLIAVSGLHVGLAAWLCMTVLVRVFAALGRGLAPGVAAAMASIAAYVVVTGGAASAIRAGVMAGLVALGMLAGRPHHGLTTLAIACTVMVAIRPAWMLDPGFQMSAAAMAGLVGAPPGASALALTWRVTWAITPVSLVHFGGSSVYGLVANLVAIPIVSAWVLPLGLVAWPLSSWLGEAAWEPAAAGARVVVDLSAGLSRLPQAPAWALAAVAAVVLVVHRPLRRISACPPLPFVVATLAAGLVVAWPDPGMDLAWVAEGSVHRKTVIAIEDREGLVRACVEQPRSDPWNDLRMLKALGVGALGTVGPQGDPAAAALRDAAEIMGWDTDAGSCTWPSRKEVRSALRACARRRVGVPSRAFVGASADGSLHCFIGGEWTTGRGPLLD